MILAHFVNQHKIYSNRRQFLFLKMNKKKTGYPHDFYCKLLNFRSQKFWETCDWSTCFWKKISVQILLYFHDNFLVGKAQRIFLSQAEKIIKTSKVHTFLTIVWKSSYQRPVSKTEGTKWTGPPLPPSPPLIYTFSCFFPIIVAVF